jgi:hypothetical protein
VLQIYLPLSQNMPSWHLTRDEAAQALGRLLAGQSQRQVAQAHSTNESVIQRLWTRYLVTGSAFRRT